MTGHSGWIRQACALLIMTVLSIFLSPTPVEAAGFMHVDEIQAGMRGTGRTVFRGSTVEEFDVEIVDVLRKTRPQGDLILFRALDERLEHSGIVAGMSGSPVYIDGRLIGAIAFAFPFLKDPVGAITPIGEMLDLLEMPASDGAELDTAGSERLCGGDPGGSRSAATPAPAGREPADTGQFDALWSRFVCGGGDPEDLLSRPPSRPGDAGPSLISLPVSLSGWNPAVDRRLSRYLESVGFLPVPMASGSRVGGTPAGTAGAFEPGQAVSIEMVRGDASLAAVGTLTHVDGDRFLALGHPMLQDGPSDLPFSIAWIHAVMPSLQISFKMGSPGEPIGRTLRDSRAGVSGVRGEHPDMLPVRVVLREGDASPRQFRYELVRHHMLTRALIPWTVTNSFMTSGWPQGEATVKSRLTVYLKDGKQVDRSDLMFTEIPGFTLGTEITLPAGILLANPFERVRIDSVVVEADYRQERAEARISRLYAWPRLLDPGGELRVEVTLQPHRSEPVTRVATIPIPEAWAGRKLRLAVGGASEFAEWDRDRAPARYTPRDLAGLFRLIESVPRQGALMLRIVVEEDGSMIGDSDIPPLPPSLRAATEAEGSWSRVRSTSAALLLEERLEAPYVVRGGEALSLEVKP